jgi:uncharacterized protein
VEGAPGRNERGGRPRLHVPIDPHAAWKATAKVAPVIADVLEAKLAPTAAMPGAAPGTARTAELVLYEDERTETGVWEVTPGAFDAAHGQYLEFMHFVAGDATITAADGAVHEVRPGVALTVPPGWRGRWEVRETVRKTYVIVRSAR